MLGAGINPKLGFRHLNSAQVPFPAPGGSSLVSSGLSKQPGVELRGRTGSSIAPGPLASFVLHCSGFSQQVWPAGATVPGKQGATMQQHSSLHGLRGQMHGSWEMKFSSGANWKLPFLGL